MNVYEANADLYTEDYAEWSTWFDHEYPQSDIPPGEWEPDHSICEADWKLYTQLRAAYYFRWPHHCRACKGQGGTYSRYDPSASGISLGSGFMVDVDPCEECADGCPRCGTALPEDWWSDDEECPVCGWDWMRSYGEMEACPEPPECNCQRQRDVRKALNSILGR